MCRSSCSPAGSCRPRRTRSCTRWRAASWSRASNRPSGCSTRPRCSCIASSTDLPPEKQRMLERLTQLRRGSGRPHRCCWSTTTRATSSRSAACWSGAACTCSPPPPAARRSSWSRSTPDVAIVLMDIMMPEMDGYQTMRGDPAQAELPPPADHRADRQGDEGRPREMPGGRRVRLSGQAGQHRAAAVRAADVAASLRARDDAAVDEQGQHPAGRRPAGEAAELRGHPRGISARTSSRPRPASEALEHLLKNEVAVMLIDVCMPDLDGFELAAMIREHPRFQKTAIIFISAIHLTEIDHLRGYEMGAVDYVPVPVVPEVLRAKVQGVRRALSQDAPARAAQSPSSSSACPSAPPSSRRRPRGCARASAGAAWRSPPARWARGTGISPAGPASGTRASAASSASIRARSFPRSIRSRRWWTAPIGND